jgi:hypothetical protein
MLHRRLDAPANGGRFICVCFNPWRFEYFGPGKVALIAAIVERIEEDRGRFAAAIEKAGALPRRLHR